MIAVMSMMLREPVANTTPNFGDKIEVALLIRSSAIICGTSVTQIIILAVVQHSDTILPCVMIFLTVSFSLDDSSRDLGRWHPRRPFFMRGHGEPKAFSSLRLFLIAPVQAETALLPVTSLFRHRA